MLQKFILFSKYYFNVCFVVCKIIFNGEEIKAKQLIFILHLLLMLHLLFIHFAATKKNVLPKDLLNEY
jgi:hypothetical protein